MINTLEKLPKLLRRSHMTKDIGFSDSLYYKLVRESKLPIVRMNNRIYIDRDKLIILIESGEIAPFEDRMGDIDERQDGDL